MAISLFRSTQTKWITFTVLACLCKISGLSAQSFKSAKSSAGFVENHNQVVDQDNKPVPLVKYLLSTNGLNVAFTQNGFSYNLWQASAASSNANTLPRMLESSKATPVAFHRIDVQFLGAQPISDIVPQEASDEILNYYTFGTGENGAIGVKKYSTLLYRNVWPNIDVKFYVDLPKTAALEYEFILRPGANPSDIRLSYDGAELSDNDNEHLKFKTNFGMFSESLPLSYKAVNRQPVKVAYKVYGSVANHVVVGYEGLDKQVNETIVIDPTPNLSWATFLGGSVYDRVQDMTVDSLGNIYVTGITSSSNNIATTGAFQTVFGGGDDAILAKYSKQGALLWSTYYGGSGSDAAQSVCLDKKGNPVIAGYAESATNIASTGSYQPAISGSRDAFMAKFTPAGVRKWGTYFGGSNMEGGAEVMCDANNKLYLYGTSNSYWGGTPGVSQPGAPVGGDCFIGGFDSSGNMQWLTFAGGNNSEGACSATLDGHGNILIFGITSSTNNIATTGAYQAALTGGQNIFIQKWTTSGVIVWGTYYGNGGIIGYGPVKTDTAGNIYFTGNTSGTGYATSGSYQPVNAGPTTAAMLGDAFLVKFNPAGVLQWGTYAGGSSEEIGAGLFVTKGGDCYISGSTSSTTGIATSGTWKSTLSAGISNAFIMKFSNAGNLQWGTYFGGNTLNYNGTIGTAISVMEDEHRIILAGCSTDTGFTTAGAPQTQSGGWMDCFVASFGECYGTSSPSLSVNMTPSVGVCTGEDISFTATAVNAGVNPQYIWTRNGVVITGATTSSYHSSVNTDGDAIMCQLISGDICASPATVNSTPVVITVFPQPQAAIVSNGVQLGTSVFNSYQWLLNGTAIAGATNQQFTPTTGGIYKVIVTSVNGCKDTSAAYTFSLGVNGLHTSNGSLFSMYPNPVTSSDVHLEIGEAGILSVLNVQGQKISNYTLSAGGQNIELPESLPAGIYYGKFISSRNGTTAVVKFVYLH